MTFPTIPALISKGEQESLLTMQSDSEDAHIIIIPPTGNPGEQEWVIQHCSENTITFRNLKYNKYLGVAGAVRPNASIVTRSEPLEFHFQKVDDEGRFHFYVEDDGEKLCLEFSLLRIFPPQASLLPSKLCGEPWRVRFLE